jgi:hypothetical protein
MNVEINQKVCELDGTYQFLIFSDDVSVLIWNNIPMKKDKTLLYTSKGVCLWN